MFRLTRGIVNGGHSVPGVLSLLLMANLWAPVVQALNNFPTAEFPRTDLSRTSVDFDEILSGGPPRDGIPAIDNPQFVEQRDADEWLAGVEPVISLVIGKTARAYPLQILMYHEIVNDVVEDQPLAVTFCPLCNASIVFERRVDDVLLDFGTTGRLRNSDLVMYDRQSESWWQQFTGRGIIGTYDGVELVRLNSQIVSYASFKQAWPDGEVLSRETGHQRPYGNNPYRGYDAIDNNPFLLQSPVDPRLPPMQRVLAIADQEQHQLVPLSLLQDFAVFELETSTGPGVVLSPDRVNSALDQAKIVGSRQVPAAAAFSAALDGRTLSFSEQAGIIVDDQTGSRWNAFGVATHGPLAGKALRQIDRGVHFAFAWLAFDPEARIVSGQ